MPGDSPLISVITPTQLCPRRLDYFCELRADLAASGVDYEWIIAVDGDQDRQVPQVIRDDPRVRIIAAGRQVGAASARNLALGIARGRYVTSADDDDRLPHDSLSLRLETLLREQVAWVAGPLASLRDGVQTRDECLIPTGPLEPGEVWRIWGCPCQPFPLGPTSLLVETSLLRRLGGWHGLPQAEDLGMTLAVTSFTPGYMVEPVVYAYRKHPYQMTVGVDFHDLEPLVRHITFERGRLFVENPLGVSESVAGLATQQPLGVSATL